MIDDPIVEEIRRYRKEHAAKYGNDIHRIFEALREKERTSGKTYVNRGPRLLKDREELPRVAEQPPEYKTKKPDEAE